ncbi:MAG: hypothetical protein DMD62_13840 [Gemmatimonadetes bacterium]|nr:MAG: hypothetical protein DMD62_13840 [Gemmatimonadota bacterium]
MDDMMDQHEDPRFEAWLRKAAESYHAPDPTPRDVMWQRIQTARRQKPVIVLRPWMAWAMAAAAVLILGIGIGRWTATPTGRGNPVAVATTPLANSDSGLAAPSPDVVYQVAATQYLSRTEAFLTSFRTDLGKNHAANSARFAGQARDLLTTTQLMLDSPAGKDQRMRSLLEDLELVLMQISQLDPAHGGHDADLITQGMNQSNVLPKLRSAIPAGPVPVRTEGAL